MLTLLVIFVAALCGSRPLSVLLTPRFSPRSIMQQLNVDTARWQLH
jgi:hypothetical protein